MIGKNMRKLREAKGYTQYSLGDILNLSPSTIGMYEQGRRLPDAETLIRMCELFNVSSDYLLEITENPNPYAKSHLKENIQHRLNNLISENEMSKATVAEIAKIRKSRLDDILSGKSPNINELMLLAECLWESTDYLLCMTDQRKSHQETRHASCSFQGRLAILMDGYTEVEIANEMDISIMRLRKILNGEEIPCTALLQKLSNFFRVSTDFLLGIRSQTRNSFLSGSYPFPMNTTSLERIQRILESENNEYLAEELGLTSDEFFLFYHYGFIPHISVLTELCRIGNVSCDYVLGLSDSTLTIKKNDTSNEELLLDGYRKLGTYYKKKIDGTLSEQILQQERDTYMLSSVAADEPLKKTGTTNSAK